MRLGSVFAIACLLGCKTQPSSSAPAAEAPSAPSSQEEADSQSTDAPPAGAALATEATASEDPEQRFCEKLTQLMVASRGTNPDPASRQELVQTCITNAHRKRTEAPAVFEREVECISRASNLDNFFECALDEAAAPVSGGNERFMPLCEKLAELAAGEPDFPQEAKRELQDTARCAADARMEHSAAPRAFEQVEACILAATSMRVAAACAVVGAESR